jgi:hypothetical protein
MDLALLIGLTLMSANLYSIISSKQALLSFLA